jgi:hypothetical protein
MGGPAPEDLLEQMEPQIVSTYRGYSDYPEAHRPGDPRRGAHAPIVIRRPDDPCEITDDASSTTRR